MIGIKGFPKKEEHHKWSKNPSYSCIHDWLIRIYGKANKCENNNCQVTNAKRYEYALKQGFEYERKRENYIMMCPSCHRKYDKIGIGKVFTEEHRRKIALSREGITLSQETKDKIRKKLKGKIPWNKGLKKYDK